MSRVSSVRPKHVLEVNGLTQRYDQELVYSNLSFCLSAGEIICLLGPSGCGKSSLIKTIAGCQRPSAGSVIWNPHPERGEVAYLPQELLLLPWLNVRQNISFRERLTGRNLSASKIDELLKWAELSGRAESYPDELSGGQRQRVALLRELAGNPKYLILDEPFTGLDSKLRLALAQKLRRKISEEDQSAIVVTHNLEEAALLADRALFIFGLPASILEEVVYSPEESRGKFLEKLSQAWLGASTLNLSEVA